MYTFSGCSTPVVYAIRVRKNRVRFSAARPSNEKHLCRRGAFHYRAEGLNCFSPARESKPFSHIFKDSEILKNGKRVLLRYGEILGAITLEYCSGKQSLSQKTDTGFAFSIECRRRRLLNHHLPSLQSRRGQSRISRDSRRKAQERKVVSGGIFLKPPNPISNKFRFSAQ